MANLLALTIQGFSTKDFKLDNLINLKMIFDHGLQVLNKSDDAANWANFWALLTRASTVAQHLQGPSNVDTLKDQLLKAELGTTGQYQVGEGYQDLGESSAFLDS